MGLCSKIDDIVRIIFLQKICNQFLIADISLHEDMTRIILNLLQILQVSCISQLIQVDDLDVLILLEHVIDKVRADESGASGYQIGCSHSVFLLHSVLAIPVSEEFLECCSPVAHLIADRAS